MAMQHLEKISDFGYIYIFKYGKFLKIFIHVLFYIY